MQRIVKSRLIPDQLKNGLDIGILHQNVFKLMSNGLIFLGGHKKYQQLHTTVKIHRYKALH
jgi:hypothetical protein